MSGDIFNLEGSSSNPVVTLPIKKSDLGSFIYGLLGQQQSIERETICDFDIDLNWLINLHNSLNQRIRMQASADLVSFKSVFYFKDGLKRSFTSVESFESYSETKKELPIGVKIIWSYLVQFPNKEFPEKQQISFSAIIQTKKNEMLLDENILLSLLLLQHRQNSQSTIRYQIDHTERTWGDDIETIFSTKVDEVIRVASKNDILFASARLILSILIVIGAAYYFVVTKIESTGTQIKSLILDFQTTFADKPFSNEVISEKLSLISEMIYAVGVKDEYVLFFFGGFFFVALITILFLRFTKKVTHSFLVVTDTAKEYKKESLKKEGNKNIIIFASYILTIISGVLASFGYSWIIKFI